MLCLRAIFLGLDDAVERAGVYLLLATSAATQYELATGSLSQRTPSLETR